MTTLQFVSTTSCMLCSRRLSGFLIGGFRVNKCSLRSTRPHLSWSEPECRECGWPAPAELTLTLSAEALATIARIRGKRGWAAA